MSLNTLPDPCIRLILSYLTLIDLLRARLITRRWESLVNSVLLCKHSLILAFGDGAAALVTNHCPEDMTKQKYTQNIVQYSSSWKHEPIVVKLLPNITHLTLSIRNIEAHFIVGILLPLIEQQWSRNLAHFSLIIQDLTSEPYKANIQTHVYYRLFEMINRTFVRLQSLKLDIDDFIYFFDPNNGGRRMFDFDLSIVSKLKSFSFEYSRDMHLFLKSLQRHIGANEDLQQVEIFSRSWIRTLWEYYEQIDPKIALKFTQIVLSSPDNLDRVLLEQLCGKFQSLTTVTLHLKNKLTLADCTHCLAMLPELVHLGLSLDFFSEKGLHTYACTDKNNHKTVQSLDRVKTLIVEGLISSHTETSYIDWVYIFPSVSLVKIYVQYYKCSLCELGSNNQFDQIIPKVRQCVLGMLNPLKQLRSTNRLERIYYTFDGYCKYGKEQIEWQVEELNTLGQDTELNTKSD